MTQDSSTSAPEQTHDPQTRKAPPRMAFGVVFGIVLAIILAVALSAFGGISGILGPLDDQGWNLARFLTIDVLLGWVPAWGVMWAYINRRQFSAPITSLFMCLAFGCVGAAVMLSKNNEPQLIGMALLFGAPSILAMAAVFGLVIGFAAEVGFRIISTRKPGPVYYLVPPLTFTAGCVLVQSGFARYQPYGTILVTALAHLVVTMIGCFLAWQFSKRYYLGG